MHNAAAIADVFRKERTRVLATAIRLCNGDFELAEEAVQDSFAMALERWPSEGWPEEPRAWLVTVARRKAIDQIRRRNKLRELVDTVGEEIAPEPQPVHDDRLRLIFTCCHPALAAEAQIALTLRTLGGLTTEEIARAFMTSPVTMAQRLVRAKNKIRDARIPYEVPESSELVARLAAVMAVIYLVFNEGYAATVGDEWLRKDLCHEAIRLGRLIVELTDDREPRGLLALMLLHDARRDTRTDDNGDVILLEDQDRAKWDHAQIAEALELVPLALKHGAGTYALEAAIAALHCSAARSSDTDWRQIAGLYSERYMRAPSPIIALNHAVAVAMYDGPAAGLELLEPLHRVLADYHLWHAARADLLRRLDRIPDALKAYRQALVLVGNDPERRFLERRIKELRA
jgi:RNA polymerase sigma-70 factor, ECF subfamily